MSSAAQRQALTDCPMQLHIELDRETDGRWLAEVPDLPGVMVYGHDREDAISRVQALALRVIADRLDHGEAVPEPLSVTLRQAGSSHRVLAREGWADVVFAFHDGEEIGPAMLSRIAKRTGLTPDDL